MLESLVSLIKARKLNLVKTDESLPRLCDV